MRPHGLDTFSFVKMIDSKCSEKMAKDIVKKKSKKNKKVEKE